MKMHGVNSIKFELCTLAPKYLCVASKEIHVILLAPRILKWLLGVRRIYGSLC